MTEKSFDKSPLPLWFERFEKVQINPADSYYEVFKLMDGIYAIFEPYNIQMVISYLIVGENRAMLFDTGMGVSPIDRVVKQLTDKPVFVVFSHSHFDHVGGAHLFDEAWGMDVPAARRNAAGEVNKYLEIFSPPESFLLDRIPADFNPTAYKTKKYKVTNFLLNGMRFDLGNRVLETYFAPGHSPDSIVMVDRLNRLLWTGDVFYVGQLFAYLGETNMKDYTHTASILGAFADQVDYLLPAHHTTMEPSSWLTKMASAFTAISTGDDIPSQEFPEYREYLFAGFSIMADLPKGN